MFMIWNDLLQEFIDIKAIVSFHNSLVAAAGGHSERCLNTERAIGS